jgi:acetoin utilization deacetylase AcuC-like enzyme
MRGYLDETGIMKDLVEIEPEPATTEWLARIHTNDHISCVKAACASGVTSLDADTGISAESFRAAQYAAGGVMTAIDAVMEKRIKNAFCAVRPPGHHAESDRAMGFCLFNNVAVGARYAQKHHSLENVLIIDWDVHHGNGTQHIFYNDPTVFYFSVHQYPYYPGTGNHSETGTGEGEGYTLNVPLGPGADDATYIGVMNNALVPVLSTFHPDLVLISAGFDAHQNDPLAGMQMTEDGYRELTTIACDIADRYCEGRLVSVLEGGYHLESLNLSVASHLKTMMARNQ